MRIGIDATGLWAANEESPSGIINYTIQITRGLLTVDHVHEYFIYCRNGISEPLAEFSSRAVLKVLRSRNRKLLQQTRLPFAAVRDGLDVMFFPFNSSALLCPCKSVVTIHDLHPFTVPERFAIVHGTHVHQTNWRSNANQWYWRTILRRSSQRASRVLAVSEVTKIDIENIFGIPADKIDVVHEGADQRIFARKEAAVDDDSTFRRKYNLPPRYILCMGTHGYKNVEGSIRAFRLVKERAPEPVKLVIAGAKRYLGEDKFHLVRDLSLENDVIFTDFFPDEDLPGLYAHADLLLFPSFYEGFGLPVVEAFGCGTPVVASTAGALPETSGDAALLVDPGNLEDIAAAVLALLTDEDLRTRQRERGWRRVKEFTWEGAARKTVRVLEKACASA